MTAQGCTASAGSPSKKQKIKKKQKPPHHTPKKITTKTNKAAHSDDCTWQADTRLIHHLAITTPALCHRGPGDKRLHVQRGTGWSLKACEVVCSHDFYWITSIRTHHAHRLLLFFFHPGRQCVLRLSTSGRWKQRASKERQAAWRAVSLDLALRSWVPVAEKCQPVMPGSACYNSWSDGAFRWVYFNK